MGLSPPRGGVAGTARTCSRSSLDELRIEHDQGDVEIVVYNRAILLFSTDSEATALRSTLPRHPPWFDHVHDPHFVGSGTAVDIHASVLPRERVDVLDRAGLGDLDHATPDRQVTVGVVGVEDREGDAGIAPHVLVLDASARRVDANVLAVEVEPDGGYLRTAVRHDGGEIGECLLRGNEIEELGRDGASGGDVLGRMATTRGCSLDTVMAEARTSASEEAE